MHLVLVTIYEMEELDGGDGGMGVYGRGEGGRLELGRCAGFAKLVILIVP